MSCGYCMPCNQGIDILQVNFMKVFFKQLPFDEVVNLNRTRVIEQVDEFSSPKEHGSTMSLTGLDLLVEMSGLVLSSPCGRCRDADSLASLSPSFQVLRNMDPPCP